MAEQHTVTDFRGSPPLAGPRRAGIIVLLAAAFVLASAASPARGQESPLRFDRLTVEQGLSSNHVKHITQDRKGFLWVATANGLSRYDGYRFRVFRHVPGDSTSLPNNLVNRVMAGRDDGLWISTGGGLAHYDPRTDRFETFRHDEDDPASLGNDGVRAVVEDSLGRVWLATAGAGLALLDPLTRRFTHFRHDESDPSSIGCDTINTLFQDRAGRIWIICARAGVSLLDAETGRFSHYRHYPGDPSGLGSDLVMWMTQDPAGTFWFALWQGGIDRVDPKRPGRFEHFRHDPGSGTGLASNNIRTVFADSEGSLWAGTADAGLHRLTPGASGYTVSSLVHRPSDPNSLGDSDVLTVFQDRDGILWFGTWRGGLNRHDPRTRRVAHVYHDPADDGTIRNDKVSALLVDDSGTTWVGTWGGGLSRFDRTAGRFVHYRHSNDDPGSLPDDRVLSLAESPPGTLWVGTWSGGLSRLRVESGRFERVSDDLARFPGGGITVLKRGSSGRLWIGADGGIGLWDASTGRLRAFEEFDRRVLNVRSMLEDRSGRLWAGYDGAGLHSHEADGRVARRFTHDPSDSTSVASDRVLSLHEDRSGRLWVGTSVSLDLMDRVTGTFTHFTTADGLPDETVNSIVEDGDGHLWIGTGRGLARFDPESSTFARFDGSDGLQGLTFSAAAFVGPGGHILAGGDNGYNVFHPDSLTSEFRPPRVVFTRLELPAENSGESGSPTTIDLAARDRITLAYDRRVFSLEFAALSFRAPERHRYAYRLEPATSSWIELGAEHRVTFSGLSPGTHTIHVRGTNGDGVWSPEAAVLVITITPPWWRTNLAFVLYGLLLLTLLYLFRRYELNRITLKNRLAFEHATSSKLRDLDQQKSRFLANLSHEFRTPLTLIIGPLQQLIDSNRAHGDLTEQHGLMLRNARRLQRLINQVLDLSRIEAGQMHIDASPRDLNALVRSVVQAMTPLAERQSVQLAGPEARACIVSIDPDLIEKVVGNLLSNALKFTPPGGRVSVLVTRREEWAEVSVQDTGIGIDREHIARVFDRFYQVDSSSKRRHEGTGIGLALAKEMAELHGGTLGVDSEAGKGSLFTLRLPCSPIPEPRADHGSSAMDKADSRPDTSSFGMPSGGAGAESPIDVDRAVDLTRILIVDDHADVRTFVRSLLEPQYAVFEAMDGLEGLDQARSLLPDLVIADVMMPGIDGYELSRTLKADPVLAGVPVVLMTALADHADEVEGLETGADHFLTKPFEPAVLKARVRNLLSQRERLREYFSLASTPTVETPTAPTLTPFGARLLEAIDSRLQDPLLSVDSLAEDLSLSAAQLRRRTRDEFDLSPNELVRTRRLERSRLLLAQGAGNVSEVAFAVGFNSLHYFSRAYRAHFGAAPSQEIGG